MFTSCPIYFPWSDLYAFVCHHLFWLCNTLTSLCVPYPHVHDSPWMCMVRPPRDILRPVCHAGVHQGRLAVAVDSVRREALGQQGLQWLFRFANGCVMHLQAPTRQPRSQTSQNHVKMCQDSILFALFACFAMMSLIELVTSWTKGGKQEAIYHNQKTL